MGGESKVQQTFKSLYNKHEGEIEKMKGGSPLEPEVKDSVKEEL